ncbi:hypothetical protein [Haloferax volcanii]|nr:hypothetical protein [Haloferax volcanii]
MVEFVEEWQRGAFLVLGPALGGGVSAVFVGSVLAFLAFFVSVLRERSVGWCGRPSRCHPNHSVDT